MRARAEVFFAAWLIFWVVLGLNLFMPWRGLRWFAGALAALWIVGAVSLVVDVMANGDRREGVVLADDVIVRKGNSDGFEPQFAEPLHQGVEFVVLEQRVGWIHIELPDGKTGWIRTGQAGLIG